MKILFVCHGNVGRSQMAEAYYNFFSKTEDAFSAGTDPTTPERYPAPAQKIIDVMSEEGIDVSNKKVSLIKESDVEIADKIYVICDRSLCPDFLAESEKATFWEIEDPYKMDVDDTRNIRDQIKVKVQELFK